MFEKVPLRELTERITYGFTNPMPIASEGIFLLTAKDIIDGKINFNKARKTTVDAYNELLTDKSRPKIGDVLITKDGSIGRVAICDRDDLCINQSIAVVRVNSSLNPTFLKYMLEAPQFQHQMEVDSGGTTIKHIYISRLPKMEVFKPPKIHQDAIANVLKIFDTKIEINQKIIKKCEEIVATLFKSWFINFDPIKNKIKKIKNNLPDHIEKVLPTKFIDSAKGSIPLGWKIKSLDLIGNFMNGLAAQKYPPDSDNEKLPVVKIAQLRKGDTNNQTQFSSGVPDKYIINDGDYIFSWSGSLLSKYWVGGKGVLNQHLFKVEEKISPLWFVACWVEEHMTNFQLIAESKATTMGHIKREHLSQSLCVLPNEEILDYLGSIILPFINRQIVAQQQNKLLLKQKNYLLPKLISGEIEIKTINNFFKKGKLNVSN